MKKKQENGTKRNWRKST